VLLYFAKINLLAMHALRDLHVNNSEHFVYIVKSLLPIVANLYYNIPYGTARTQTANAVIYRR